MLIIGLTGGIGSGKSAASQQFEALGIKVVDADIVAREVVQPGTPALQEISRHFGSEILQEDGQLNRAALRKIIFSDASQRTWLEQLLHPIIRASIINQLNEASCYYSILASPLLLETDQHELCDRIIVVDCSEEQQLERSCRRDANSAEQIKRIISTQMPRQERLAKADYIIDNSNTVETLNTQVEQLHAKFCSMARQY